MKQKSYKPKQAEQLKVEEPTTAFVAKLSETQLKTAEYLTVDEFKQATNTMIDNLYKKHGLL